MEFQIPKFIERQPRIIWTITFRQFIFLAITAGALGILYLSIRSKTVFWFVASITAFVSFLMVFVKVQGRPFSIFFANLIKYIFNAKLYIWRRKAAPQKLFKKVEMTAVQKKRLQEMRQTPPLKITERSRLRDMANRVETGL